KDIAQMQLDEQSLIQPKNKMYDLLVPLPPDRHLLEAALKPDDVRGRRQVLRQLFVKKPRAARREAVVLLGKVSGEEVLGPAKRGVARLRRQWAGLRYVNPKGRIAVAKRRVNLFQVRGIPVDLAAIELQPPEVVDRAAEVQ